MLKDITLGQYYPTKSIIHSLDARTKLLGTLVFMASIFVINQFWPYIVALLALVAVTKLSNIPFKYVLKGLKPLRWVILFTFVINVLFIPGDKLIFKFGIISISELGLRTALFMAIRLMLEKKRVS